MKILLSNNPAGDHHHDYDQHHRRHHYEHCSPTILPEIDLGVMSIPCCMKAPSANQRLFTTLKWLLTWNKFVCYF